MFTISKAFTFSASHRLIGLPDDHPCSRLHGHNYTVTIELAAVDLDHVGFVVDYRALDVIKAWLDATFDHRHINDAMLLNPTAELMAMHIHGHVRSMGFPVSAVGVRETDKTYAEFRP